MEHFVGVAKPAQFIIVGLEVAVHKEGMDAHTDTMLADECNLVLYLVLDHLQGSKQRNEKGQGERKRINRQKRGTENLTNGNMESFTVSSALKMSLNVIKDLGSIHDFSHNKVSKIFKKYYIVNHLKM